MKPIVIMVVDDDPTNRFILAKMLKRRGYAVVEADSGPKAIEFVRDAAPALVLMDINMPEMTGVEAALEIANLLGTGAPNIVAVTANNTSEQRAQCEAAGFQGFVPKPVKMQTLFDILDERL